MNPGPVRSLQGGPIEKSSEVSPASLFEGPGLLGQETQATPDIGRPRGGVGQQEGVTIAEDLIDHGGGAEPPPLGPQRAQMIEGGHHRMVHRQAGRRVSAQVPAPTRLVVTKKIDIGAGIEGGTQSRHQADLVAGVRHRPQHGEHIGHFLGVIDQGAGGQLIGHFGVVEGVA